MSRRALGVLGFLLAAASSGAATDANPLEAPAYSAAGLYNAGNAAARAGELPRAILDYERALVLDPRDADTRANLRTVRARAGAASVAERDWRRSARIVSPGLVLRAGLLGLCLLGMALIARELLPRGRAPLALTAGVGAALVLLTLLDAFATAPLLDDAVALHACAASASPIAGGETLFTVSGGDTVAIEASHGEYWLIRDAQGREGWVARAALERVVPASRPPAQ